MNLKSIWIFSIFLHFSTSDINFFQKPPQRRLIDEGEQPHEEEPIIPVDNRNFTDYEDTAEKSIEFQKIKEEYLKKNPIEFSNFTPQQIKEQRLKKDEANKKKSLFEQEYKRGLPSEIEKTSETKPNKFPTPEIEKMVKANELLSCNRRFLNSYLENMRDDTFFSIPHPPSEYIKNTCPSISRTCCLEEHFKELVNLYFAARKKLDNLGILMNTFIETIKLLNMGDIELFAKSPELSYVSKCVGLPDLGLIPKIVQELKDSVELIQDNVNLYLIYQKEHFSGFICYYCSEDAEKFFIYKKNSQSDARVQVNLHPNSCVKSIKNYKRMMKFMEHFSKYMVLVQSIRCVNKEFNTDSMTISNVKIYENLGQKAKSCYNDLDEYLLDDKQQCIKLCKIVNRFTFLKLPTDLDENLVKSILVIKKKFNLNILAPGDLLSESKIDTTITFYKKKRDWDFSLEDFYSIDLSNTGMDIDTRPMNFTYLGVSRFNVLLAVLFFRFLV